MHNNHCLLFPLGLLISASVLPTADHLSPHPTSLKSCAHSEATPSKSEPESLIMSSQSPSPAPSTASSVSDAPVQGHAEISLKAKIDAAPDPDDDGWLKEYAFAALAARSRPPERRLSKEMHRSATEFVNGHDDDDVPCKAAPSK
ncbi:hypothetical protein FA95DRAFT_1334230 [Auriscalpium vulgare]|uniref:Uncharacterized protein n=1 Tax=Auriscalpium vulgare TaxID=40419 RepID=A0ACB8RTF0_9AGAM|nr:hypothetical protein FA95DRAFT_1334230 [Auriscalpium vulgare]